MKMEQVSFLEWQERYGSEAACIDALRTIRCPEGTASGILLLLSYSLGIGLPLFISAMAVQRFIKSYRRIQPYMGRMAQFTGILLMVVGGLLLSNSLVMIGDMAASWAG